MKYLLLLLSLLIVANISLFAGDMQSKIDELPKEQMQSQNKIIAKMFADEISKNLPQKIDNYTEFVKIKNIESTVIYTFEINTGSKSDETLRQEDRTRMYQAVQSGVCISSMKFLEAGIDISYVYISKSSKANLFRFDITLEDCIKVPN